MVTKATGGSIGISVFPDDGVNAGVIIKNADIAMYQAKQQGRNRYQFYSEEFSHYAEQRFHMEKRLRKALEAAADGIKKATSEQRSQLGVLSAPWATVEELHLLERLARGTGSDNIDHRLQQIDFSGQGNDADYPGLGMSIADIDDQQAIALVGCRVRQEVPMLAHRVRKAHTNGAKVSIVNESND